ncbi:MAG TPA: cell envelope biogenesis protein TolA [Methylocystis sp.]|nr:cell envelope biogenesis protein TolA [Methylocystis sp.]
MLTSRKSFGFRASVALHAGLLAAALYAVADARKFEDAVEATPVEVVSDSALNQVAKGEKAAPPAPKPALRSEKAADEPKPHSEDAKRTVEAPPPPLRRLAEPSADEPEREPPTPPKRVAALPPEAPPAPTPPVRPRVIAAPQPEREEPKEAEVVRPKPPQKPKPEKVEQPPTPPEKPKLEKAEQPAPKPPEKPRLKLDEVAKLLQEKKPAPAAKAEKAEKPEAAAKPKSGDESAPKSRFSAASIASLLSHEAPQQAASGKNTQLASLGAPTGLAPKMSPSLEGRIDALITEHYQQCWQNRSLTLSVRSYVPQVELQISRSGALSAPPKLLNPSSDPVERAYAEQALASLRACPPLRFPQEFLAYYDYWRVKDLNMLADR